MPTSSDISCIEASEEISTSSWGDLGHRGGSGVATGRRVGWEKRSTRWL